MVKTTILIFKKISSWCLNNFVLLIFLGIGTFLNFEKIEYEPRVIFLDVGQGDAILLIDSSGKKILIDGGGGDYIVYSITKYLHPRDRNVDFVVLTHPHEDHLSGLIDIVERFEVDEILHYPACYNSALYNYFLFLDENINIIEKGFSFNGESFVLNTVYPIETVSSCVNVPNVNNASIIMKLESDLGSILFMGDAEHEIENFLMDKYRKKYLGADILKAGHHCSRTASSSKFLNYIDAKYAVCSVGKENKFGHPHAEVIENFENLGIGFDLTSEIGDIVIEL
jgi:competence protein ComEC